MAYRIIVDRRAGKDLKSVRDRTLLARFTRAIDALAETPRPPGAQQLRGYDRLWRIKIGDWRICYRIEDDRVVIVVVTITPHGEAYERLRRREG